MNELIGAAVLLVGLCFGTKALTEIHRSIQKAALEKASQGVPSLTRFTKALKK